MAKYINLDDMLEQFDKRASKLVGDRRVSVETMREFICNRPKANVKEIIYAHWEWFDEETGTPIDGYEREWGWRCSHCKEELSDDYDDPDCRPTLRFCFNCGAEMDEE